MADAELNVWEAGTTQRRYLREAWAYRELFWVLARRDIQVRYKQAFFGVAWAVVRPLTTMLIFSFAFGKVANLPSQGVPYHLFVLAGTLCWQLFASAMSDGGMSLLANANIVAKTYFPRLIVPASSLIVALIDLSVSLTILLAMVAWYGIAPSPRIVLAPLFIALAIVVSLGAALWISALNVRYRDVRHMVPFLVQFGLFISPVGYATGVVPPALQWAYRINPMVAPIEGLRWCLFGTGFSDFGESIAISVGVGAALMISGYLYFKKTETTFADVI